MTRKEWEASYSLLRTRWSKATEGLKKGTPVYDLLGNAAWNRGEGFEIGAEPTKDTYVRNCGALVALQRFLVHLSWCKSLPDPVRAELRERFVDRFNGDQSSSTLDKGVQS